EVSATNEITISMWVNGSANQPVSDTVLNAVDTSGNRILNIHLPWSNGDIFWDAGDASGYDRVREGSTPSEYSGSWSFWVFTKNANTGEMSIYLNGALKATETGQTSEIGEIASVVLGDNVNGGNGYEGAIDEVRIYSQALDSAQVLSRYHDYLDKGGYDAWFDSFPNTSGSGGLIGGKEEDFDGDGILNLMEYVLNSDPTIAGLDLLPVLKLNGGEIVFRFTRRAESAEDTSQYFQYSINLIDWNDLNITGEQAPEISIADEVNGTEDVTVTLGEALAPDGRLFGRLRVMAE
ncbi:LamG domain-containing protein, partial [bacterium]|nr:LamG domain-containing protein [bacterium]